MAAPLAGQIVRTSHYPKVRAIKKAADESVTSSAVLQNDDDFSVALAAGKTYRIELFLTASGIAAGDIRIAWAVTGGVAALGGRHVLGPESATTGPAATLMRSTGTHALTTNIIYGLDVSTITAVREDFLVETPTAGTAGALALQWAQGTSNATATIVRSQSVLYVTEIDLL